MLGEISNLPNISSFPQFKYETYEEKTYQGHTYYVLANHTSCTTMERVICAVKALALTLFSGGVALFFSYTRELWKTAISGIKQVKVYATDDQLPLHLKLAIDNSWNKDPQAVHLNVKLTEKEASEMLENRTIEFEELPLHLKQKPSFLINLLKIGVINWIQLLSLSTSHPMFDDEHSLLTLISYQPHFIAKASQNLLNNKEFLLKAININEEIMRHIPLPLSQNEDEELILKWTKKRIDTLNRISSKLKQNDSFFNDKLRHSHYTVAEYMANQKEVFNSNLKHEAYLLSFISNQPSAFNLLPESMKSDPSLLMKMANRNSEVWRYFPTQLLHDQNFISNLIENSVLNPLDFYEGFSLMLNTQIMKKFIEKNKNIDHVPYRLLNNRDFLLKILDIDGVQGLDLMLPKKFANDKEVILKWIKMGISYQDICRISPTLKKDLEFVKKAKECNPDFEPLLKMEITFNKSEDLLIKELSQDPSLLDKVDLELLRKRCNERAVLLKFLEIYDESSKGDSPFLKPFGFHLPEKFAHDEEIVLKWIQTGITRTDVARIAPSLKQNPTFVEKAKTTPLHGNTFDLFLREEVLSNANEDEAVKLIKQKPELINYLPSNLNNSDFIIRCLKEDWSISNEMQQALHLTGLPGTLNTELIWKIAEEMKNLPARVCTGFLRDSFTGMLSKREDLDKMMELISKDSIIYNTLCSFSLAWR